MNDQQLLKNLIKQGESEKLEFSEVVRKEDIARTLCGFLNANGGTLLIGIYSDGKVIGVNQPQKHESDLKKYLFQSIIPEAPISVSTENIDNKTILVAKVWIGSKPPYVFNGSIYLRKGSQTLKATSGDISKLIIERQNSELHWERQPALGIGLDELDELVVRKTIKDLALYGRGKVFDVNEVENFLTYYGLYRNGNLTNSAVVLFAKNPTQYLPQCRIRLTVFKGTKSSDTFIYDHFFEGNLFLNIDAVLQFFEVNIATKSRFSDKKWLREDLTFPKFALREGLMNAMIHRDFTAVSGTVLIAFYPDRLEITNSGELYGGYTPFALTRNHLSVPRNPDIAHICFLRQLIEKIGRGTIKMIEDCEQNGYPKPIWQSGLGVTSLTFKNITVTSKTDDAVNDAVNDAVSRGVIDAVSDAINDAVFDTVKIVAGNEKGVSINEIINKTGKSNASVKRYLQILKTIDLIEFKGAAKTGKYFITSTLFSKIKENEKQKN